MTREEIVAEMLAEYDRATEKFGPFNSDHEGYAVMLEEMDELWDVVKLNPTKIMGVWNTAEYYNLEKTNTEGAARYKEACQRKKHREMKREEAIQLGAMAIRFVMDLCQDE